MSRIRTIKPEFCVSEQLSECSPSARLVFALMWMFCDDQGIHPAKVKKLRGEVFPLDDEITTAHVGEWVKELLAVNLLREYEVSAEKYWIVTGWSKHQKIDKPTSKHPLPLTEQSPIPQRVRAEPSPPEGKGREGKGVEGKEPKPPQAQAASVVEPPRAREPLETALRSLFATSRVSVNGKGALHIAQWITEGVTVEQLTAAIAMARERKPDPQLIPVAYLAPIVADLRAGRTQPVAHAPSVEEAVASIRARDLAENPEWWLDEQQILDRGKQEGVEVRGEEFVHYQARVFAAAGPGPWQDEASPEIRELIDHYLATGINPAPQQSSRPQPVPSGGSR